ncbi:hypothetical protein AAFN85_04695 [Mucilaginibacter sp. CAU 1740]|uniref:hypothetical protein n=1 Tax=Mucilaginibacter sp. CAU 1740 TaxID=3140365 RepID=UPI00325A6FC4
MKKFNYLLALFIALFVFVEACKKGDDGPAGPKGADGANGATGATGPAGPVGPAGPKSADGSDGSMIYSGTGAPTANIGNVGDFYLNKSNGLLYGPKTETGWSTSFSLKGPTGATGATGADGADGQNGKDGNTVLSGTGVPATGLGKTGDYYLDKNSYLLYGPKAANSWGAPVNLRGPAGPQGPAGTANVIYSDWVYAKNFRDSTIDNSLMHVADIPANDLTTENLSHALIQVYFTYGGGVFPLPHLTYAGNKASIINFAPRFKHFNITRYTLDNSNSVNLSTVLQYRYVIIPGGIAAAKAKNIDVNDYESVRRYLRVNN